MNAKHVLAGLLLLVTAACSNGGDSGTPPTNEPPVLTFTTPAIGVEKSSLANLTVSATDPDEDPLTITWAITRGALTAQNSAKTVMRWSVPATVGVDTVNVSVTDGTFTRKITAEIKVGTRFTSATTPGTFFKANSPYILAPSTAPPRITVLANATTDIEAGTEFLIDTGSSYIQVLGALEAHGTEDEPIVFRPNNRTFNCSDDRGWWEGIRVESDDLTSDGLVDLEYVEIWDARWGVRVRNNASAIVQNCKIRCSGDAGILIEGTGSLSVQDSRVSDGAIDGIAIWAGTLLPQSVNIERCTIVFNGNAGIRMDLNDATQAVPIVVEYNTIEFNASHGISLSNSVFPSIHFNAFRGNGENTVSNLFLQSGYPDPVVQPQLNAACNFWGSPASSQATIDASIRDSLDTSTVHSRVISSPWLNASPITTPPVCTP